MLILIMLNSCISLSLTKTDDSSDNGFVRKTEIESLKFYTAAEKGVERSERIYNDRFRTPSIDHIWYELTVANLTVKKTKMILKEVWTDGSENIISSTRKEMNLLPENKYLEYSAGIKTDWEPGWYTLKLYQDSLELVTKEFKITE